MKIIIDKQKYSENILDKDKKSTYISKNTTNKILKY